jgi:4-hydroxybenzoyl-CoA thioesterase
MFRNRIPRIVHFSDCDPAQIVFYPRYFTWIDQATESLFHAAGLKWERMFEFEDGGFAGVPLLDARAEFRSACRMGDELVIESWIDEWRDKVFVVKHNIHNGERVAVEAHETRIWAVRASDRPAGIRAASIPAAIREKLSSD